MGGGWGRSCRGSKRVHKLNKCLASFGFAKQEPFFYEKEEHFVFFLAYEVTTLKVIIEFAVNLLFFGRRRARSHFAEQLLVLEPTKPPVVIFQPRFLFKIQP